MGKRYIVPVEEQIRGNAELTIRTLGPISGVENFGYNAVSVKWVEGFIERQRIRLELDKAAIAIRHWFAALSGGGGRSGAQAGQRFGNP